MGRTTAFGRDGVGRPLPLVDRRLLGDVRVDDKGCWVWTASRLKSGYGVIALTRGEKLAHRASYARFVGPIPKGKQVCHKCDNPPCCNPDHLFLASQRENLWDMVSKGRDSKPGARLTPEQVTEIRTRKTRGPTRLAREYGVSISHIHRILKHEAWKIRPKAG